MARLFLIDLDLNKNELRNARIQNLASDPASPVKGQFYLNTSTNKMRVYNGTGWDEMGTSTGGDASTNTSTSVDSELALFSGTGGKTFKRATNTGLIKLASGVVSTATAGTDYTTPSSTETVTNKTFNASNNTVSNLTLAMFAANVADTDTGLAANSNTRVATQAAVKTYVDNLTQGLSWKNGVRAASTANVTIASALTNGSSMDGVTLATGDRVILKNQTTASENGIYIVVASGAASRATDMDGATEFVNATAYVAEGTANADTVWTVTTNGPITVGSTTITWAQVNGGTVPTATTSTAGKVILATQAEAEAKTDTAKAVVSADLANFPIKKTFTFGDGSTLTYTLTHSLGTKDVITQIRLASDDSIVEADIVNSTTSAVTVTFAVAPTTNAIKAVVVG